MSVIYRINSSENEVQNVITRLSQWNDNKRAVMKHLDDHWTLSLAPKPNWFKRILEVLFGCKPETQKVANVGKFLIRWINSNSEFLTQNDLETLRPLSSKLHVEKQLDAISRIFQVNVSDDDREQVLSEPTETAPQSPLVVVAPAAPTAEKEIDLDQLKEMITGFSDDESSPLDNDFVLLCKKHFYNLIQSDEYLNLPHRYFVSILQGTYSNFKAVQKWVDQQVQKSDQGHTEEYFWCLESENISLAQVTSGDKQLVSMPQAKSMGTLILKFSEGITRIDRNLLSKLPILKEYISETSQYLAVNEIADFNQIDFQTFARLLQFIVKPSDLKYFNPGLALYPLAKSCGLTDIQEKIVSEWEKNTSETLSRGGVTRTNFFAFRELFNTIDSLDQSDLLLDTSLQLLNRYQERFLTSEELVLIPHALFINLLKMKFQSPHEDFVFLAIDKWVKNCVKSDASSQLTEENLWAITQPDGTCLFDCVDPKKLSSSLANRFATLKGEAIEDRPADYSLSFHEAWVQRSMSVDIVQVLGIQVDLNVNVIDFKEKLIKFLDDSETLKMTVDLSSLSLYSWDYSMKIELTKKASDEGLECSLIMSSKSPMFSRCSTSVKCGAQTIFKSPKLDYVHHEYRGVYSIRNDIEAQTVLCTMDPRKILSLLDETSPMIISIELK